MTKPKSAVCDSLNDAVGPNSPLQVGQLLRAPAHGGGFRVWIITGIYLGGERQENVVSLATLDLKPSEKGELLVPERLLEVIFHGSHEGSSQ